MKKVLADKKASEKKKKQRGTNLGEHGFYYAKMIDGKTYQREVTGGCPQEKFYAQDANILSKMSKAEDLIKKPML